MPENEKPDELWSRLEWMKRHQWNSPSPDAGEAVRGSEEPSGSRRARGGGLRDDDLELDSLTRLAAQVGKALGAELRDEPGYELARARLTEAVQQAPICISEQAATRPAITRVANSRNRRRVACMAMAAALLLIIPGLVGLRLRATALPVGEFVKDHIELLGNRSPAEFESSDARQVANWLRSQVGFAVAAVQLAERNAALIGGRHCKLAGQHIGLSFYQFKDERILLFQLQDRQAQVSGLEEVRMKGRPFFIASDKGFNVAAWQGRENYCVMVAACDASTLLQLAEFASWQTG